ncbi:MAG: VCBS repeat-containing protein [Planctomycetes bacterium]|nr:VCBS repeat-containing protein [Planctomycetota bacterium]
MIHPAVTYSVSRRFVFSNIIFAMGSVGILADRANAQFTNVSAATIPQLGLSTESVKFGDFDLDGDLDIVWANGGDAGNQQSKLIQNELIGGGGHSTFTDVTAVKFLKNAGTSVMTQSSRDVELADIDNDGDIDFYMSNHSMISNQSNTWFINQGMAQGGTAGKFLLDMNRWVGIGVSGSSSVPLAQKITSGNFAGGFVDWSCQCDFADVDIDGDWDLLHTSYGPNFDSSVMTRLFINEYGASGALYTLGFFREYNPSNGFSNNPSLPSGSGAGFLEGTQLSDTTDATGATHDITNTALDADFSDLDGDFDFDIFANSRDTVSRFYQCRFYENGGNKGNGTTTRLFRDVTSNWGANGIVTEMGTNYDADLNDIDNDGDADGYFVNYSGTSDDEWRLNDGTGTMGAGTVVTSSGNDDNEIDWIDHDNDGDVDAFISAFQATDKLYKNQFMETGNVNFTLSTTGAVNGSRTLGTDIGDFDNDGDPDIICGEDAGLSEVLLQNNGAKDVWAPRVDIQQLANTTPQSAPRIIVIRGFDNSNQEHFIHAVGTLQFTANGHTSQRPAYYSGANGWTTTIPGYWVGTITYGVRISDRAGNTGVSQTKSFTVTQQGFSTFGTSVPGCHGAMNLSVNSCPTMNNPEFQMLCTGGPPNTLQLCLVSNSLGSGQDEFNLGLPIWADLLNATDAYAFDATCDPSGTMSTPAVIPNTPSLIGSNYYFQFIVADGGCGQMFSTSGGGKLTIHP